MPSTPLGLPYPTITAPNNPPADFKALAEKLDELLTTLSTWKRVQCGKGDHTTGNAQILTNTKIAHLNASDVAWETATTGFASRVVAYIPAGYRPKSTVYGVVATGAKEGRAGRLKVGTDGVVWAEIPSGSTTAVGNSIGISLMWEI